MACQPLRSSCRVWANRGSALITLVTLCSSTATARAGEIDVGDIRLQVEQVVTAFNTLNPLLEDESLTPGDKITGDVVLELDLTQFLGTQDFGTFKQHSFGVGSAPTSLTVPFKTPPGPVVITNPDDAFVAVQEPNSGDQYRVLIQMSLAAPSVLSDIVYELLLDVLPTPEIKGGLAGLLQELSGPGPLTPPQTNSLGGLLGGLLGGSGGGPNQPVQGLGSLLGGLLGGSSQSAAGGGQGGPILDPGQTLITTDVTVTLVPEPAAWLLAITGSLLIAANRRRRRPAQ